MASTRSIVWAASLAENLLAWSNHGHAVTAAPELGNENRTMRQYHGPHETYLDHVIARSCANVFCIRRI
jgi:hypothetical protein